jgi:glutamyl-tRNA synthetase
MSNKRIRVRFAPSPTGPLHIGGVRTALYNYLFAKQHGGDFILRIEDTDSQRFVPGAEEYIIQSLDWLGVAFDESPHTGGKYGPYRQSERKDIYKRYVDQLLENRLAYFAFDTPEELEAKRSAIPNFQYDASTRLSMRNSLTLPEEETRALLEAGKSYTVRIRIEPDQMICIPDVIRGKVHVNSSIIDDKVLYKSSDGLPTYHLANVVDDHLMEITHVIRGEEWLPSASLHVILYQYLGWENTRPVFAHLPLLLKPEGNGKLSKRDGDRLGFPVFPLQWSDPKTGETVSGYREAGYLPEALLNFLALLGWNPGDEREIFSIEELIDLFTLEKCSKNGAKFDYKKGEWFNHQYIQLLSDEALAGLLQPVLNSKGIRADQEQIVQVAGVIKERIHFTTELWNQSAFFFAAPDFYDEKAVKKWWKEDSAEKMQALISVLQTIGDFSASTIETTVLQWITSNNYSTGAIMNLFRLSLVGESKGPNIFAIAEIIGTAETIKRLEKAIDQLTINNS